MVEAGGSSDRHVGVPRDKLVWERRVASATVYAMGRMMNSF